MISYAKRQSFAGLVPFFSGAGIWNGHLRRKYTRPLRYPYNSENVEILWIFAPLFYSIAGML